MLEPAWMGRRVVVRRVVDRDEDGRLRFGDIIGDLVALSGDEATVETRQGGVTVALAHVVAARVVEPSTADILALEATAARGWRAAETEQLGGWLLRANGGVTGRANSVLPLRQPGRPLDEALDAARGWYAKRRLPLRIQLALPARGLLDLALADQGWQASPDVQVLAGRLATLLSRDERAPRTAPLLPRSAEIEVELADTPDDGWLSRYRRGTEQPDVRDLLSRHDRLAFASARDNGRIVAIGRGVVDDGWLGITGVEVAEGARRLGLATAIMRALWQWAIDVHAATYGYLQVQADDRPAVALYAGLGYWHHHDYRYRTDPSGPPTYHGTTSPISRDPRNLP
ncbi:MAG: GNAT family N-acetyltransferase [Actinomycetota bacterium]